MPKLKRKRVAIVMLACRDYKSMELALACHMRYRSDVIPFFVLQNCRGCYDSERTYEVGRRYAKLFPDIIKVVDRFSPKNPYFTISELLKLPEFSEFDLILKVDDDAFPISPGWLDRLVEVWESAERETPDKVAYVTPLINNNGWGFVETLNAMGLKESYFQEQAHTHLVGSIYCEDNKRRIVHKDKIVTGGSGTIWGYPHIARWLHERTTLKPDEFISATHGLSPIDIPTKDRYSIGCILFRPDLWKKIDNDSLEPDDEGMMHSYCDRNKLRIICARDVPFIHIAFFTQREENRDIVDAAKSYYEKRLGHPFPISLYPDRMLELENRLRVLEARLTQNNNEVKSNLNWTKLKRILKILINNPLETAKKIFYKQGKKIRLVFNLKKSSGQN